MDYENPDLGFCFTWVIRNFSTKEDLMRSSKYIMGQGSELETHWLLGLYPNVVGKNHEKYVSLYLSMEFCNRDTVVASYSLSIVNKNNVSCKTRHDKEIFKIKQPHGFMEYVKQSELLEENSGLLVNDRLKIICEICIGDKVSQLKTEETIPTNSLPFSGENNEYWQLYLDRRMVDTTIQVKNSVFYVHRLVLAANSQVFESMFRHGMLESSTNAVTIEDCDPEVFAELLRFVYTKRIENIKEYARGLLICADRYDLKHLKKVAEREIGKELTKENAAEILILADTYNADNLKVKALDYISSRAWFITKTPGWEMMLEHPRLLNEVVIGLASLTLKNSRQFFEERRASGFFLTGGTGANSVL